MITYPQLIVLEQALRRTWVLSVFLPGAPADPADRPAWRLRIDEAWHALRRAHAADSHADRQSLEDAIAHVEHALSAVGPIVRTPGWFAFATSAGVQCTETLPVPMPRSISWEMGARFAPLLEALKEQRPAFVALVEGSQARLYRYAKGVTTHLETVHAEAHVEPPQHMGGAPRPGFHTGTRGRTGTDQAQRERVAARARLMSALADRMAELAGGDGWLLFGGAPTAAKAACAAIRKPLASRAHVMRDLHLRATPHEITHAAAKGASVLRRDEDLAAVRHLLEELHAAGHGVTGHPDTSAALAEHRLDRLLLSRSYIEQDASEAERLTRDAIGQGIPVESVTGPGGDLLDRKASGIAGRVRYVPKS